MKLRLEMDNARKPGTRGITTSVLTNGANTVYYPVNVFLREANSRIKGINTSVTTMVKSSPRSAYSSSSCCPHSCLYTRACCFTLSASSTGCFASLYSLPFPFPYSLASPPPRSAFCY